MINGWLLVNNYTEKYQEPTERFPALPTRSADPTEREHQRKPHLKLLSFSFQPPEATHEGVWPSFQVQRPDAYSLAISPKNFSVY